jgi:hypothetical protein
MAIAGNVDPRLEFLDRIDIAGCTIEFSGKPIVLLCGGKVPSKSYPSDQDPPLASLRHAISRATIACFEIFRPEEIEGWQTDAIFKDLVSFELELASICSLVVVIPESAGSLAELGAFSQIKELNKKLIVFCAKTFEQKPSFINLGILRYLRKNNYQSVKLYPWPINNPAAIENHIVQDIVSDIESTLKSLPKTAVFKLEERTHIMVLICAMLRNFLILKESEIFGFLRKFGFSESMERLKGKLYLLEVFKICKKVSYGDAHFYVLEDESFHHLRLKPKGNAPKFDDIRIQIECRQYYENDANQKRNWHRALSQRVTSNAS